LTQSFGSFIFLQVAKVLEILNKVLVLEELPYFQDTVIASNILCLNLLELSDKNKL